MRITNNMLSRGVLADIMNLGETVAQTQRKLSSGREINRPSDDPFGTSRALELRRDIEANQQYQRSVGEAVAWQSVTDVALSQITDLTHLARELITQGSNDTASPAAREAIAAQIDQLIEAVKQESNATYAGRYVFAGTANDTATMPPPYAVGGGDVYSGDTGTIARTIGPGVSLNINVLGSDFLGGGQAANDGKLLDVLRDAAQHLRGGTAADINALRTTDLAGIVRNVDEITRLRATVGATTNRLETALGRLEELEETATSLLSETEDADMAKTLVDFSMQQSVYKSALQSGANVVQASLLDFLR